LTISAERVRQSRDVPVHVAVAVNDQVNDHDYETTGDLRLHARAALGY
jgi:hypothetical protein